MVLGVFPQFMQEARIRQRVEALERDTGVKLRVLAQNYPETPGTMLGTTWLPVSLSCL